MHGLRFIWQLYHIHGPIKGYKTLQISSDIESDYITSHTIVYHSPWKAMFTADQHAVIFIMFADLNYTSRYRQRHAVPVKRFFLPFR